MFDHHELPDDVEHEGTHEMSGGSDVFPRRSFSSFTASRLPSTFWGQLLPPRLRAPSAAGIASSAKFIINMGIDCLRQACGGELRAADALGFCRCAPGSSGGPPTLDWGEPERAKASCTRAAGLRRSASTRTRLLVGDHLQARGDHLQTPWALPPSDGPPFSI